jgi:hypothetical protein
MAELSEVLVLRLENYERQQKEITQLQDQIVKLQQRCKSVSWGVGIPPLFEAPLSPSSFSLSHLMKLWAPLDPRILSV